MGCELYFPQSQPPLATESHQSQVSSGAEVRPHCAPGRIGSDKMKHHLYGCQPLANRNPLAINVAAAMKSAISHRVIVQSPRIVGSTTLWSAEKPDPQA